MSGLSREAELAKDVGKALEALEKVRKPVEPEVDNIITYVNHGRRKVTDKRQNKGKRTGVETFDSTALEALNILVDGLCGYTLSRSFRWFSYVLPTKVQFSRTSLMRGWSGQRLDSFPEVKQWLLDYEEVMYEAFKKSNLYDIVPQVVRDAASIGTVSPILEEDIARERFVVQVPHFRECYLAQDIFGVVDTCYRVYDLTNRQLKKKFGLEGMKKADSNFEKKLERDPYEDQEVLHAIFPREDYSGRLDAKGLPVASCWFLRAGEKGDLKLLEESGYREMPSFSWRWRRNEDELYGRSPIWDAMVEVMTGHQQGRTNLVAAHKMADPPMVGTKDLRGKVNAGPEGRTWVDEMNEAPKPLNTGIQLPFSVEAQERTDEKIRAHLQTDFFMLLSRAALAKVELTATQVYEMSGEKAVVIAGRVGQMESEFMARLQERATAIEVRARRVPPPPQILLDQGIKGVDVEYLGPFSQIQKRLFRNKGLRAGLESLTMMAQVFPEALYVIDPIKTAKDLLDSTGFPVRNLRPDDQIEGLIAGTGQGAQLAEQGPAIAKLLKAIPGLGKGMEKGSILEKLMEAMGGEGAGEV